MLPIDSWDFTLILVPYYYKNIFDFLLELQQLHLKFFFLVYLFICVLHHDLNLEPPTNPSHPFITWAMPQGLSFY